MFPPTSLAPDTQEPSIDMSPQMNISFVTSVPVNAQIGGKLNKQYM